jgi:pimeloyl-ACP methyl ester carboxylesterase
VLEVISRGNADSKFPPLLFVHGAWHGAWCWDEHFLDFFADRGFRALALSLRGHGTSDNVRRLSRCSLADYLADVASVADTLPTPPVLIGHSLGGLIVQKYLETRPAPAGVLLASVPPRGTGAAMLRIIKRHPWIAIKSTFGSDTLGVLKTPELVRLAMFSPSTPEPYVERYLNCLRQESKRVLLVDGVLTNVPKPERVRAPMLVLGAEWDGSITQKEVRDTARAYRTEAQIFPDLGHDMMLEPGWRTVAERIADWVTTSLMVRQQ